MDKRIRLTEITGLGINKIPEELHPKWDDQTMASSLAAITGLDVRRGAIFDIDKMADLCDGINPYYLKKIFRTEPAMSFVFRLGPVDGTYPNSLSAAWDIRKAAKQRRLVTNANSLQLIASHAASRAARSRFDASFDVLLDLK